MSDGVYGCAQYLQVRNQTFYEPHTPFHINNYACEHLSPSSYIILFLSYAVAFSAVNVLSHKRIAFVDYNAQLSCIELPEMHEAATWK